MVLSADAASVIRNTVLRWSLIYSEIADFRRSPTLELEVPKKALLTTQLTLHRYATVVCPPSLRSPEFFYFKRAGLSERKIDVRPAVGIEVHAIHKRNCAKAHQPSRRTASRLTSVAAFAVAGTGVIHRIIRVRILAVLCPHTQNDMS